jgi:hypothetical protein
MRDQGRFLSTRESGKQAAADLARIAAVPGDVILDFKDVEAATPPFLQELIDQVATLIIANQGHGRIVVAAHLNQDVAETLRYVAAHAKRGIAYLQGGEVDLLEDRPKLVETLREARRLKPFFTAPQLAERLDINSDTATQRLKTLVELGAAVRWADPDAQQGLRHLYRVADPRLAEAEGKRRRRPAAVA